MSQISYSCRKNIIYNKVVINLIFSFLTRMTRKIPLAISSLIPYAFPPSSHVPFLKSNSLISYNLKEPFKIKPQQLSLRHNFKNRVMVEVKPDEVSAILREQLSNFKTEAELEEVGTILQVGDGIARVYGLTKVRRRRIGGVSG